MTSTHLSYEDPFKFRGDVPYWQDMVLNQPVQNAYCALNPAAGLSPTVPVTGQTLAATTDGNIFGQKSWTFLFNAAPGWVQGILQVANIDENWLSPQPISYSVDFNDVWDHASILDPTWEGSTVAPDDSQRPFYYMVPKVQAYWRQTWVRADHYAMPGDPSGYTGFAGQGDQHFEQVNTTSGQIGLRGSGDFYLITAPPL